MSAWRAWRAGSSLKLLAEGAPSTGYSASLAPSEEMHYDENGQQVWRPRPRMRRQPQPVPEDVVEELVLSETGEHQWIPQFPLTDGDEDAPEEEEEEDN